MVIELYTQELVNKMRAISHREVAQIEDAEARYRVEAGTEKMDEILSCLSDASKRLEARCIRFLQETYIHKSDNLMSAPQSYVFRFNLSERRAVGKTESLKEAMNTFMLEYALAKFYSDVSSMDLSNKHSLLALEAANLINELLLTKQPPML